MEFEWDEEKRQSIIKKHGVDLLRAARIFRGQVVTVRDSRFDYQENRYVSIGRVDNEILVLIHTPRNGKTRLISARKGGPRDYARYSKSHS